MTKNDWIFEFLEETFGVKPKFFEFIDVIATEQNSSIAILLTNICTYAPL